jgi:hypothetical protein
MKKILFALLALFLVAAPALASDPYVVPGVTVDVTADNAAAARGQAIREAHRKAFMTLATQLSPEAIPDVPDAQLGNLVSNFAVQQEKFSGNRYVATYLFRFRQNATRGVFAAPVISPRELATKLKVAEGLAVADAAPQAQIGTPPTLPPSQDSQMQDVLASVGAPAAPDAEQPPQYAAREIDANAPINQMLIELPAAALDAAALQQKMQTAPGVVKVDVAGGSSLSMAYRGDTAALVKDLAGQGIALEVKAPTVPPLYRLKP